MLRKRAIQIGLKGKLSELYVDRAISITDVTKLSQKVNEAHTAKTGNNTMLFSEEIPVERPYKPLCSDEVLERLGMLPGDTATAIARLGLGKALTGPS